MIRALQEETGTKIDINDDGTVFIAATDGVGYDKARERIEALTETPQIGRIYTGKVVPHHRFWRLRRNPAQYGRAGSHFSARFRAG